MTVLAEMGHGECRYRETCCCQVLPTTDVLSTWQVSVLVLYEILSSIPIGSTRKLRTRTHHGGDLRVDQIQDNQGHSSVSGEELPQMMLLKARGGPSHEYTRKLLTMWATFPEFGEDNGKAQTYEKRERNGEGRALQC